ncbi:hypothetical protein PLICRDRAFT_358605 [Plicaturopsis crispa FD-325 SS-3]|uniref:Uncharacterized protein n=1 Tax=Plicaturopsis crispa FD-325 SS-3 TaxID=944288 RepID=A0A0C9SKS8_PLICR|nr:hypothetical protein PLICRDRAFT_358605 [Plicaturopsis crispa FD-325 SS-3]
MDQSHFHTPDCGCDHDADARALARAMANVKRDPQGAVRTLESAHVPEPMLFQAVVNCSLNVPRIRRSGAPAMFLRFIKEGYRSNAEPHPDPSILPPRQWERPVIGILNILVAIRDDKSQAQDSAIVSELIRGIWA